MLVHYSRSFAGEFDLRAPRILYTEQQALKGKASEWMGEREDL